jgi:hypothetical protein
MAMSEYAAAPVSSETEVVLGGGKEYAVVEVTRRSHCSHHRGGHTAPTVRRSRRSHCSMEARGDPATASDRVYLDGIGEQGPIWALIFLFLKKRFWVSTGNN